MARGSNDQRAEQSQDGAPIEREAEAIAQNREKENGG